MAPPSSTRRKRKAAEPEILEQDSEQEEDDESMEETAPAPSPAPARKLTASGTIKLTKAEKAAKRARVQAEMGIAPPKRRKTNHTTTTSTKTPTATSAPSPSFVAKSPAAAASASTPAASSPVFSMGTPGTTASTTSSTTKKKKPSIRQQQREEARRRAKIYEAELLQKKQAKKAKGSATAATTPAAAAATTTPASTTTKSGTRRKSTSSTTAASNPALTSTTSRRRSHDTTTTTTTANNNNQMPEPPASFATAAAAASVASPTMTTPFFPQPGSSSTMHNHNRVSPFASAAAASTPMTTTTIDVGVVAPKQSPTNHHGNNNNNNNNDIDEHDETINDETKEPSLWKQCWTHPQRFTVFFVVCLFLIGKFLYNGGIVYNPNSGMLMIMGSAPVKQYHHYVIADNDDNNDDDDALAVAAAKKMTADKCYFDSPNELLETMDPAIMAATPDIICRTGAIFACPANAICYKGSLVACRGPVWQLYALPTPAPATTPSATKDADEIMAVPQNMCVLSAAVNETYQTVVEYVEQWSIQHLCLNHVDGPQPLAYYTTTTQSLVNVEGTVRSTTNKGLTLLSEDARAMTTASTSNKAIPLYAWMTIYRQVDVPEELDDWDWELLKTANGVHKQLVLEEQQEDSSLRLVALTSKLYWTVESTKLATPCKVSRRLRDLFDGFVTLCLTIVIFFGATLWSWLWVNYYATLGVLACAGLYFGLSYWRIIQQDRLQRANHARKRALQKLQNSPHTPGMGLQQGEFVATHLRDSILFELHGSDDEKTRKRFVEVIWPMVIKQVRTDNRVRKFQRVVQENSGPFPREIWMWVAPKEEDDNNSTNNN